ncbi:hypothetical protein [Arthrobacter sp. A5]|uniref:hypothetical protein n=1 Tax=Arthrobacter sp. A5 TaxID=576926 RepID=UPI003DA8CED2
MVVMCQGGRIRRLVFGRSKRSTEGAQEPTPGRERCRRNGDDVVNGGGALCARRGCQRDR